MDDRGLPILATSLGLAPGAGTHDCAAAMARAMGVTPTALSPDLWLLLAEVPVAEALKPAAEQVSDLGELGYWSAEAALPATGDRLSAWQHQLGSTEPFGAVFDRLAVFVTDVLGPMMHRHGYLRAAPPRPTSRRPG